MKRFGGLLGLVALGLVCAAGEPARSETAEPAPDPVGPARERVKEGRFRAALEFLEPLIKSDKKNIPARLVAADACLGLEDPDCAAEHLAWVAKLAPETPGYQLLLGRELLERANRATAKGEEGKQETLASEADKAFQLALVETPGNPRVLQLRVMALRAAHKPAEATEACDAWIAAFPRNLEAYGLAAAILADGGRWEATEALIARVPPEDPALLQKARFAVLRNGLGAVPWTTIRPLFEQVEAGAADPDDKRALVAYRAVVAPEGPLSLLAALDYLDADPADGYEVAALVLREGRRRGHLIEGTNEAGFVPPQIVRKVVPALPDPSRRAQREGSVVLLARVRIDGAVGSVHVLSSTNSALNRPVIDAVRQWRYTPATLHGVPVEMPYEIRFDVR